MASKLLWIAKRCSVLGGARKSTSKTPPWTFSNLFSVSIAETESQKLQVGNDSSGPSLTDENEKGASVEEVGVEQTYAPFESFSSDAPVHKYEEGSFQDIFKKSQFVLARNPVGKEVEGMIIAVHQNKLYVDFGCKFHAVVICPDLLKKSCCVGTRVSIVVDDLEVTGHFIGDNRHNSLMEAKAEFGQII